MEHIPETQDISPALSSDGSDEKERLLGGTPSKRTINTGARSGHDQSQGEDCDVSGGKLYDGGRTWPISLVYIVANEFCERFCYYGMRAILTLYFLYYFEWDEDRAVVMYHTFIMLCYLTPILGGALADGALGKYKTILILSIVYVLGTAIMSGTAVNGATGDPPSPWGAILGLLFIAVGTGGESILLSGFFLYIFFFPFPSVFFVCSVEDLFFVVLYNLDFLLGFFTVSILDTLHVPWR
eukprot:m.687226 g.687226  ORF g.687226 m.687226 type:complete len:240 (+) comp22841_c0_seq12:122-841(+)